MSKSQNGGAGLELNQASESSNILLPPSKAPEQSVFEIEFYFTEDYRLDINVHKVSNNARLAVTADGVEVYSHYFIASDRSTGDWAQIDWNEQLNIYQSVSNRDYRAVIPAGTSRVVVGITDGDWLSVNNLRFSAVNGEHVFHVLPNVYLKSRPMSNMPVKLEDDGDILSEISPVQEPAQEPVAVPDMTSNQVPVSESARRPTNRAKYMSASASKRNPWLIGVAMSAIAIAALALKKRR